ncbi:MAG: quinolinate synthase NadA [Candidatus Kaelpia aquatica]|nr:quinolinate synthase NadA [Candidatus Kaelpia aquatica]
MNIVAEIQRLKKEKNAVILVHNYQLPQIQDIADFLGDSLGLSIKAAETEADIIVFCGVRFMAETAKILSPNKLVILPEDAGCPMADMLTGLELEKIKAEHPKAKVLCYVNTSAEVKALSDICCTSANSVKIAREAFSEDDEVIFVPDRNLAFYTQRETGRKFITTDGYCPIHADLTKEDVVRAREDHPKADLIVHPECSPSVIDLADGVYSTSGMLNYVRDCSKKDFIIGTEIGIIYRLEQDNPGKNFYPLSESAICHDMKKITLEKVLTALEEGKGGVELASDVITKARGSIDRMLEYR